MGDATDDRLRTLAEMIEMSPEDRARHQLRILDGLLARAVRDKKYEAALKITEEARMLLNRYGTK